ncbi:MAG: type II toxin-antitoxin system Phd/YefM family antitoxin [Hydrogenophaga sp.]|uniref:type II toxin-antitoxin system Phd/YefM family antitoxin n=1 Tax=Hydrogenophaga sp. TaxID=1904254 RepID=UPI002770E662|nr:type II toxin-antitoxin system Phd/YefM family antitoxin [Hydrogenophaga sp.]MDP2419058.1 type II toxin-antitoxin system Phd/YefM family antitoxin [Hydrogenophaga sp.]MDZ4189854.1 type II toxin-antitoxin system Phd/YefM family antitoxin [Hydrogenophaga sp.]
MKTMTARDAKTHFGEFLDAMQREPVVVAKNNRPVGIMLSIQDAADTLIPEMFMDKEAGYDEWFAARVSERLAAYDVGAASGEHEDVMARVQDRLNARARHR